MAISVKLLNGDVIVLDCVRYDNVIQQLSTLLNVHPQQLSIFESCEIGETCEVYALISDHVVHLSKTEIAGQWKSFDFLRDCVNESILKRYLSPEIVSINSGTYNLYKNPHDMVVKHLLSDQRNHTYTASMSANPSDAVLDFLFAHPEMIDRLEMCCNSNDRAVQYICDFLRPITFPNELLLFEAFASNSNSKALDFLLDKLGRHRCLQIYKFSINPSPHLSDIKISDTSTRHFYWPQWCTSHDEKLLKFFLDHHQPIPSYQGLFTNSCDAAVDWILSNEELLLQNKNAQSFAMNSNPRAAGWLLNHQELIEMDTFFYNSAEEAVDYSIDWLKKFYNDVVVVENEGSMKVHTFRTALSHNTNLRLMMYVIENCPLLKSSEYDQLRRLSTVNYISVVFDDEKE